MDRIVVVGASLAGVHAAEALRAEGFDGSLTIIGDERHRPYDRPPLSKQVLTDGWTADRIALPAGAEGRFEAEWELDVAATSLDLEERLVELDDGRSIGFDGLVIATGARPRTLPGTDGISGVHTLRRIEDAEAILAAIEGGARRVVVVGAGFIGGEVASSCRSRGLDVTMVEPLPQPLTRVLGDEIGAVIADLHRRNGVDLRLGVGVASIASTDGRVTGVVLGDGEEIPADLVIVGIGVIPNTGWLEGSGLDLSDGIRCDETLLVAPGVVAAGDVASWPNPLFGETARVEHWEHAIDMAKHAARRLLSDEGEAYAPVPWFWSDQHDRKFQLAGRPRPDDALAVVAGSLSEPRFCALYGRDGRVTAVLASNMASKVVRYRRALADGLGWDEALREAAEAASSATEPARSGDRPTPTPGRKGPR